MKKYILIFMSVLLIASLISCNNDITNEVLQNTDNDAIKESVEKNIDEITDDNTDVKELSNDTEQVSSDTDTTDSTAEESQTAIGGSYKLECCRHLPGYHGEILRTNRKVDVYRVSELIQQCGGIMREYYFETKGKLLPMCPVNLAMVVEELGLSEEELFEVLPESIYNTHPRELFEVLYSGDIAAIEEAWCNTAEAFYHDGRCWCIWDIVDSDLETLVEAGVPGDQVVRLIKKDVNNPNVADAIFKFIKESTQEGLAEHFGFTKEDFVDISAAFDEMAEYYKLYQKWYIYEDTEQEIVDNIASYIINFETFEVSASLDVIGKEETKFGVIGGEENEVCAQTNTNSGSIEIYSPQDASFDETPTVLATVNTTAVDANTAIPASVPIYIDEYPYNQAGPMFELNEEARQAAVGTLQGYLEILYDKDMADSINDIQFHNIIKDCVIYENDSYVFHGFADRVSVISYEAFDKSTGFNEDNIYDYPSIVAAMEYVGIKEPKLSVTIDYNLKGEAVSCDYIITEATDNAALDIYNNAFKIVKIYYSYVADVEDFAIHFQSNKPLQVYTMQDPIAYGMAVEAICASYPNADMDNAQAIIYYNSETQPGYHIPCYRFSFSETTDSVQSDNGGQREYRVVDVPMVTVPTKEGIIADDEAKLQDNEMPIEDQTPNDGTVQNIDEEAMADNQAS